MALCHAFLLLALLLTDPIFQCTAEVATISPEQAAKVDRNCAPFASTDSSPKVMLIGSLPIMGRAMISQIKQVMGGSLKIIHKLHPNEIGLLCDGDSCVIDLEKDLCSLDMHSTTEAEFVRHLGESQVILHFSGHRPVIGDTISLARLMHAVNEVPSTPRFIHVIQAGTHSHSELEQAIISHTVKLFHPTKKVNYIGEVVQMGDVYGPQDTQAVEHPATIPQLIHQAFTSHELRMPPERASSFYDFVHVQDAANALKQVSEMEGNDNVIEITTGQLSSLEEAMSMVSDFSSKCLKRNVQVPVISSFRAASRFSNMSRSSWPPHWRPQMATRTGIALTMMEMLKRKMDKKETIPKVDMGAALACLQQEAELPGKIYPFLTLAAQLRHRIVCKPPSDVKLGANNGHTLIVMIGVIRAARLTWYNFQQYVMNANGMGTQIHIALASPAGQDSELEKSINAYYANAKYVWEVNNPPGNNFRLYFDEIARACFNRSFSAHDASVLGSRYPGNFLGLIKEAKHEWGGSALLLFKWLAVQQMLYLNLLNEYKYIVISRSDFMWGAPHPPIMELAPSQVLIPTGSDWGGINDRHIVMLAEDAVRLLTMCYPIIDRPGQQVIQHLDSTGFHSGVYDIHNSEAYLLWWLQVQKMEVKRFPCVSYIVWDRQQPGNNHPFFRPLETRPAKVFVMPKYIEEYDDTMQNKGQ